MNKKALIYSFTILILFIGTYSVSGQSKKLRRAQEDLAETRSLLNSLSKKSTRTYMRYQILEKQINLQENLQYSQTVSFQDVDCDC